MPEICIANIVSQAVYLNTYCIVSKCIVSPLIMTKLWGVPDLSHLMECWGILGMNFLNSSICELITDDICWIF